MQRSSPRRRIGNRYRLLPIAPTAGLYLIACGYADDARFARLFGEVWQQIPPDYRRPMLAHWHLQRGRHPSPAMTLTGWQRNGPHIECVPTVMKRASGYDAVSHCPAQGTGLYFAGPDVDRMPDAAVKWVIAHVLAHVFQHATGCTSPPDSEDAFWYEVDADMLAWNVWGIDLGPFDAWCLAQIEATGTTPVA